ncbi:MAG: hypothetical protein Fues2KO_22860 [Fuerstiella sp.]
MVGRFAGAADMAQRRRRRLAQQDAAPIETRSTVQASSIALPEPLSVDVTSIDRQLLRRFLSPRLWKHVVAIVCVLLSCIGVLWTLHATRVTEGFVADADSVSESPSLQVNPTTAQAIVGSVAGGLVLLSGQLALLIGMMRSRSEVDFRGRYRWWKWLAVSLLSLAIIQLTSTSAIVPALLVQMVGLVTGPIQAARHAVLLVPVTVWSVVLLTRIVPDMNRCRPSQVFLLLACLTGSLKAATLLAHAQISFQQLTLDALTVLPAFCCFSGLLLHARFVTYICNDPPAERISTSKKGVSDPATSSVERSQVATTGPLSEDEEDEEDVATTDVADTQPAADSSAAPKEATASGSSTDSTSKDSGNAASTQNSGGRASRKAEARKAKRRRRDQRRAA